MLINSNKIKDNHLSSIQRVFVKAQEVLSLPDNIEVNIAVVSKLKIKHLNAKFRNTNKVTDVLSFPNLLPYDQVGMGLIVDKLSVENYPQDTNPLTGNLILGDIYICLSRVRKQGRMFGHGFERELSYLSLHGLLHLLGYDHMTPEDKKVMRKIEEKILPQGENNEI